MISLPDVLDHQARVLIVDDERFNRQLLEVMLAPDDYVLEMAESGAGAFKMIEQHLPDLILLDLMLPDMDGYVVATKLKENPVTRGIPVIIVTALDDRDAKMRALSAGAEDFLSKPVDRAELSVRVRNLLRLKAYGDYHDKYSQMLEGEITSRSADLVESERLYRSTFEEAPVGIVHVGLDGRWLRVNQQLCNKLGYDCDELQGSIGGELLKCESVNGEGDAIRQMAAGSMDRHVVEEKRYQRRDGTSMWARVSMSVHRNTDGKVLYFIFVIEDNTERRILEAQVRQSSKMDAMGQLASGVAHDFNNLLSVILGFTEIVMQDEPPASSHRDDLSEIVKAAQRAATLTKQLLAFSRQQVMIAEPLDVNGLVTDMTGMLSMLTGGDIEVDLSLSANLPLALVDRGQLEQVVMNLVVNARDAMPTGGHVTIETTDVELENSVFHREPIVHGRYVMLSVTDNGNGMSKDTQRRLFEPFFTTKESGKGTGLGLSTTYGIVKQSKGYIWVYSEMGAGTTFKVYLPQSNGHSPMLPRTSGGSTAIRRGHETVLLVEDELAVRMLAKRILQNAGFHVIEASNGKEAEEVFTRKADLVDLLVSDVMMPGCDGPELLRRLRVVSPDVRALFMSGYSEQTTVQRTGIDRGFPFVQKPFTSAEFVKQVRNALDQ